MNIVLIILVIAYLCCIGWLYWGMGKIDYFKASQKVVKTSFSILIPFRDEAEYLPDLLASLAKLEYAASMFEVILIDDASADESRVRISAFAEESNLDITILDNIRQTNSPKKDAIRLAIKTAKYPWIVSTDADVTLPIHWLSTFDQYIQTHSSKLIVGPVIYMRSNGWLGQFQALDQLSLQASTLGGFGIDQPFLCSGANLCYEKAAFEALNPFATNSHIASGDDIFMLHIFKKHYPKQVHFIKSLETMVTTYPEKSWNDLVQQRLRWAAKTGQVKHLFTSFIGILVLLVNMATIAALIGLFLGQWKISLLFLLLKFGIDYVVLRKTALLWKQSFSGLDYSKSALVYPFFIMFIAIYSMFSGYRWKGERYKN